MKNQIRTNGKNVPRPVLEFDESSLPKYIVDKLYSIKDFVRPSVIQSQAWPVALQGRDLIGIAQTGSGKTLSFLLPGIVHIMAQTMIKANTNSISMDGEITTTCFIFFRFSFIEFLKNTSI